MGDHDAENRAVRVATWAAISASIGAGLIANTPPAQASRPNVVVQDIDGHLVYSEGGRPFRALPLSDPAAAEALRAMLRAASPSGDPVAVDVGRTVVADGAAGYHRKKDGN